MKNLWKSIPVVLILLTGCSVATLQMKVDPALETNSRVHEVQTPKEWSDEKKLNVSFGDYRVTDMNIRSARKALSTGSFWTRVLFEGTGIMVGGVQYPDASVSNASRSYAYAFSVGDDRWNSECMHLVEEEEIEGSWGWKDGSGGGYEIDKGKGHRKGKGKGHEKGKGKGHEIGKGKGHDKDGHDDDDGHGSDERRGSYERGASGVETTFLSYICEYRYPGKGHLDWTLYVTRINIHSPTMHIRMTNGKKQFFAYSTGGVYVGSDGTKLKTLRPPDVGYTWTDGGKKVGAVSTGGSDQKVWLDKRNPGTMNDALAMASASMLIYERRVAPTTEQNPLFNFKK